jgi:hypothetical protein
LLNTFEVGHIFGVAGAKAKIGSNLKSNNHTMLLRNTAKPVFIEQPLDPKIVAVVDRWSLFRGHLGNESSKWEHKIVVVIDS